MRKAVCSGSFDPVTNGHIDIFERAGRLVDELVVCVFHNVRKQPFFPVAERVRLLRESTRHIPNLRVDTFSGLLTDYLRERGIRTIVRGMRSALDFDYERREEQLIRHLAPEVETIFLLASEGQTFVSSSAVRELAAFRASVHGLVPPCVEEAIRKKLPGMGQ